MENLLSTSLKNIKKFIDFFCRLFDEYYDKCFNSINKWKFIYDDPFFLFIKIIKNENNNRSDNEYKIKFNQELINCNLDIDFDDKRIDLFLWKIYKEIIFESKAFLNEFKEKSPVAYEILLQYSKRFCKLDFESLYKYYLKEYTNINNSLFKDSVVRDFFQNKASSYWYIKKRRLCYEFFIESDFCSNFKNWIYKHKASKNEKYKVFENKSIESIINVQKDLLKNIIFGEYNNESFLFPKLRILFDNVYQLKHGINWYRLKKLRDEGVNHIDNLFSKIIEEKNKKEIFNSIEKRTLLLPINLKNKTVFCHYLERLSVFKNKFLVQRFADLMNYFSHYQIFEKNVFDAFELESSIGSKAIIRINDKFEYVNQNLKTITFFFLENIDGFIKFLKEKVKNYYKNKNSEEKKKLLCLVRSLDFFKNAENFYNKKEINFNWLKDVLDDADLKCIYENYLDRKTLNNALDFVWSIQLIKESSWKFIPLLLFSNDLISEKNFWKILNLFDYDNY